MAEEEIQKLRSKATELLLREEWKESEILYSQFITLCQDHIAETHQDSEPDRLLKLRKSLCLALSNRAEARFRTRDFSKALEDCNRALEIDGTHFKTLFCKGKILLDLNRYSMALECFKTALLDGNSEILTGFLERCKKMDVLSKTGAFDLSDWVLNGGCRGKSPELAEYMGAVEIKKSDISGRGLFATKNIDAGALVLVTKAIAMERSILVEKELSEEAQLIMWKNFIDKVTDVAGKCDKTHQLMSRLSSGENEDDLEVPEITLFRPEMEENVQFVDKIDQGKLVGMLDVNALVENAISAKILGKNNDYYGVGLWLLPSFINHSCCPNARRLHVGDYMMVHASRDIKAGEEITFTYFDNLSPLEKRKEMSITWGIQCKCKRCRYEEEIWSKPEIRDIEIAIERGMDMGNVVYRLEEVTRRWMVKGKEKAYLRASFWYAYSETFKSERSMKKWGTRIPALDAVVDSVIDVVGVDERLLKILMEGLKKNGGGLTGIERTLKLGKGVYGRVVKKQAMRNLLELDPGFQNH